MRKTPDALMMFAAGFGTRMGPLTRDTPKPLIKVAGKPLLQHALDIVDRADLSTVVVNTHYHGNQIAAYLRDRPVTISDESPALLDTGGGLKQALPHLGMDPVFTMNTDAVWSGDNPLAQLARAWDPDKMDALLLLVPRENAIGHTGAGDFTLSPGGRLNRGPGHVYTGVQILRTEGLATIADPIFSLNLLWDSMLVDERIFGVVHQGQWCDVGHPQGITLAEQMLSGAGDV
ncbi:nucleotidyltransferase family protein [Actibacterium ureilyticum]|uniref:nucleotidyltransferase family protein n=1 Tax=Actibacterium ureilyticum TaxID=1590614 RepID=UPI000BAABFCD|nr:nucleotidyltransferase family protein [Actibacterium ureilyticum]